MSFLAVAYFDGLYSPYGSTHLSKMTNDKMTNDAGARGVDVVVRKKVARGYLLEWTWAMMH